MAEGRAGDDDRMSDDIQRCPDTSNLFCDTCLQEENHVEAHGYCIDCNEYLCLDCFRSHKRAKPCRNHVLQDKYDMPTKKPDQESVYEACSVHENELLNMFCKSHDTFICKLCRVAKHRKCEGVKNIIDICHNIFSSDEYMKVTEKLQNLKEAFENETEKTKHNADEIGKHYKDAIEEVSKVLAEIRNRDLELMKSIDVACKTSVKTIGSMITNLDSFKDAGKTEQAFLTQKKAESKLKAFEESLKSVEVDNRFTAYTFERDPRPDGTKVIGKIQMIVSRLYDINIETSSVSRLDDINIRTSSDTLECTISGIDALNDDVVVLADYINRKLKSINISTKAVTSELRVSHIWDLTNTCGDKIALTMYGKKQAVLVKCSDSLKLLKTVKEGDPGKTFYQGIAFDGHALVISYYSPNKIEFVNLDGSVKQTIHAKDRYGITRFGDVEYIALNPDKDILYLSERAENRITRMQTDGTVLSTFKHEQLRIPKGLTIGPNGNVCVCSRGSHKIFEISPDLSSGRIFLDEQNGISKPQSIYYSRTHSKLFIGSEGNDELQVFLL